MASILTATVFALLFAAAGLRSVRWRAAFIGCLVVALGVFPASIGRGLFGLDLMHVTVAAAGVVALLSLTRRIVPISFIGLGVFLLFGLGFAWGFSDEHVRGTLSIICAVLAWVAGAYFGTKSSGLGEVRKFIAGLVLLVVIVETVICVLQIMGYPIFETAGRTADLTSGRANGTFSHPSVVGKVMIILMMLILPLTRSSDRVVKRLSSSALAIAFFPIFLSGSRANIAAAVLIAVLWTLLSPRVEPLRKRIWLPSAAVVVTLIFLDDIVARFAQDPEGQSRQHFMGAAFQQLQLTPLTGVGPTSYVSAVGRFDWLTAQGWPVHNTFLLQIVEIGLIGAAFFFAPLAIQFFAALPKMRVTGHQGDVARALVVCTVALAGPVGSTGWGLLTDHVLYLWFFVTAYSASQTQAPSSSVPLSEARVRYRSNTRARAGS
jgi:hypothetical protein